MKAKTEFFLFKWIGLGGIASFLLWHLLSPIWIHLIHAGTLRGPCADCGNGLLAASITAHLGLVLGAVAVIWIAGFDLFNKLKTAAEEEEE